LKTTHHKLEFNDEIKNKLNFTKKPRIKIRNQKKNTKMKIFINQRTTLKISIANMKIEEMRKKNKREKKALKVTN